MVGTVCQDLHMTTTQVPNPVAADIMALPCMSEVVNIDGMTLIVNHRSWPAGTDLRGVMANTISATSIELTQDGRHMVRGWHTAEDGPETDWVFFEVWDATGRRSHGWIDSVSRKLLQVG